MKSPQFTWSDAWLLLSVALAAERGRATLKDVIAAGDAVNHAIFTLAELRRGFAKFIAAGHVTACQDGFDVSARSSVPSLSEGWYCCAEPTAEQLAQI